MINRKKTKEIRKASRFFSRKKFFLEGEVVDFRES